MTQYYSQRMQMTFNDMSDLIKRQITPNEVNNLKLLISNADDSNGNKHTKCMQIITNKKLNQVSLLQRNQDEAKGL